MGALSYQYVHLNFQKQHVNVLLPPEVNVSHLTSWHCVHLRVVKPFFFVDPKVVSPNHTSATAHRLLILTHMTVLSHLFARRVVSLSAHEEGVVAAVSRCKQ